MSMCTDPEFQEHWYGKERTTDSIFTGCIYRELAAARPPVFSDRHMRLLIQDVDSSQMIKLSRQIPFSFHRQGMPHFFPSIHKYSQGGNGVSTALLS